MISELLRSLAAAEEAGAGPDIGKMIGSFVQHCFIGLMVVLLIIGVIVPKWAMHALTREKDNWREAFEKLGRHDGYATECPGGPLYAWVKKGAPRPEGTQPAKQYEPLPGPWFSMGRKCPVVARMHDRLVAEGSRYQSTSNKDTIGSGDVASYEAFQRNLGFTGSAATWPPGPASWAELKVLKG
ncbi:hypothetical protein [Streptomyces olivochromogenes]|uniref:Uncharacterized protein n=1 Tax=Streptomyces olivochromogenes TaxID=1963 RepID=A0A250VNX9_STROL|nr:hypothetical protein [Streptomyces olivochromogenes]GAX55789.1 hypothetical protein SO3561_07351 [Streptomyces olivochromogenes]